MSNKEEKQQNISVYNNTFESMQNKFKSISVRSEDVEKAFALHDNTNESLKILELGCYGGRDYEAIKEFSTDYTGIDISEVAISYAKQNNPNTDFIVSDFETYTSDTKYDIIFAFASLIHADHQTTEKIFRNIDNYTASGTIIYLSMKESDSYEKITKTDNFGTRTYYHYSLEEYKQIGEKYFKTIFTSQQNKNNQDRFTIAFKK